MGCIFVQSEQLGSVIEFQGRNLFFLSPIGGNSWAQCHTAGQGRVWPCAPVSAARSGMWAKDPAMLWTACELCCLLGHASSKFQRNATREALQSL